MLRTPSSIMPISSQLKSSSWLISGLIHVALIAVVSEIYITKTNHKNDGLQAVEFIIYKPETSKLSQKEIPIDIATAVHTVNSKTVSKQKDLSLKISENGVETIPKTKIATKKTVPARKPSRKLVLKNAGFSDLASKRTEYKDKNTANHGSANSDKTGLDVKRSIRLGKLAQQSLGPAMASEAKSSTNQIGLVLNETSATAPDTKQIRAKIFESKKSDDLGKINNEQNSVVDFSETTPDTITTSINSDLYTPNQGIITQTKFFTSTSELAIKKKLLENWAAKIRKVIVDRTLGSKLNSDVRISFKISRAGEILNIETIGGTVSNESIKNFIDVIRTSGKFPMAPQGLKLNYVTFPVNFQSRG
jgi:hypothetical protein